MAAAAFTADNLKKLMQQYSRSDVEASERRPRADRVEQTNSPASARRRTDPIKVRPVGQAASVLKTPRVFQDKRAAGSARRRSAPSSDSSDDVASLGAVSRDQPSEAVSRDQPSGAATETSAATTLVLDAIEALPAPARVRGCVKQVHDLFVCSVQSLQQNNGQVPGHPGNPVNHGQHVAGGVGHPPTTPRVAIASTREDLVKMDEIIVLFCNICVLKVLANRFVEYEVSHRPDLMYDEEDDAQMMFGVFLWFLNMMLVWRRSGEDLVDFLRHHASELVALLCVVGVLWSVSYCLQYCIDCLGVLGQGVVKFFLLLRQAISFVATVDWVLKNFFGICVLGGNMPSWMLWVRAGTWVLQAVGIWNYFFAGN